MNAHVPLHEITRGRQRVVYLDPARYSPLEQAYIAARTTRTFDDPDTILSNRPTHFCRWLKAELWDVNIEEAMRRWLYQEIVVPHHDSVLEFAGSSGMVWVSGVSLATLRDVDRHRLFSYEEYTTRALSENLKELLPWLEGFSHAQPGGEHGWGRLKDLFYLHPSREQDTGQPVGTLCRYAQLLAYYIQRVQSSNRDDAADIYRYDLPWALRTPFCMAANPRAWGEALGKRTCYREGHREYVDLYRLLGELLHPVLPFVVDVACRWCPQGFGKFDHGCCRHRWEQQLLNPGG